MGKVILNMSMSLDGFIAGSKDDINPNRELGALDILHDRMFRSVHSSSCPVRTFWSLF